MTNRLTYIFIELPKFGKTAEELDGNVLEGMYFCLKNMQSLKERPASLRHGVFDTIFGISELIEMEEVTRDKILENMTTERDLINQFEYARKEGREMGLAEGRKEGLAEGRAEGREEGREEGMKKANLENAMKFKQLGVAVEIISQATGLSIDEIEKL